MTYEQLLILEAIVSEGTFRGAASRLYRSQSAVSNMLKKLEEDIGILLFSREAYRPKLTIEGEVFYRHATRALDQMRQLKNTANTLRTSQEAEVFIVISATCPMESVLNVIGEVAKDYPATHIRFSSESMGGPLERLLRDNADIIIASMDDIPVNQVEAAPYCQINILPVAASTHEAATSDHIKTVTEMQSYIQVVVADSSREFEQSRDLLPGGLRWRVSDFSAKKTILKAGMGWGGLPEHQIYQELNSGELVPLSVESFPPRQSQLHKIRLRDATPGIVSQAIWDKLAIRQ